ncbi:MAG: serine/threonine-protein kinase, partial [Acidobacteriota bacterium]
MHRAVREHVWHTDRTPEEQRVFRERVASATRQFVSIATLVAIAISAVSWPLDYLAFRDRGSAALLWHITEWRLIVIGWSLALLLGFRAFPRHVMTTLVVVSLAAVSLLGVSVGKVGPLKTNFVYTFYLLPQFAVLVFVPIVQRVVLTFAIPVCNVGAYLMIDRDFLAYPYLPTMLAVLAVSCALSIMIGHLFYDLVRVSYFRGRDLEQERLGSERLLRRLVDHTTAELQRQIAARSQEVGEVLAKLAQQPREPIDAGRIIDGRYRVIRWLGAGGAGAVHEVERIADGQRFALKTLRGNVDPEAMARFAREAEIAARLHHPNLVAVVDFGVADGGLFLVMELIEGGSLENERDHFGDAAWALPLLCQIATGLAAMHGLGIVHRDLKPENILVANGVVRIADFGLASLQSDRIAGLGDGRLTHAGEVFGTFDYMSPELAGGSRRASAACDVFAFGVLAYEMTVGTRPFTDPPVVLSIANQPIPAAPARGVIGGLLKRCLDVDPDKRPAAAALVAELRSVRPSHDDSTPKR